MKKPIARLVSITSLLFFGAVGTVLGMPMFARKYKLECNVCHTIVPRLTETGFNFRAAGFRMPEEIGKKDEKGTFQFNIGDYDSLRLQARYDLSSTDNAGVTSSTNQLTFAEITLYPLTGAFLGNYSSLFEISFLPAESPEVENAYGRGNWKAGPGQFSVRLGIFHPFEGYGASDRPLSIGRPLLQTTAANFNQSTFFTPWNFDEAGLEVGYTLNRSAFRATLFNGLSYSEEENTATPATGLSGNDSKVKGRPSYNSKDYQLFFNQILTDNGGGISLYYYSGVLDLPVTGSAPVTFFKNGYERYAVYASYPIGPVLLLGSYQGGKDDTYTAAAGYGPSNTIRGYFGEADFIPNPHLGVALRYDDFDPSTSIDNNKIDAFTVAVNGAMNNGLQAIAAYTHTRTEQKTLADKKVDAFQIRFIWIW